MSKKIPNKYKKAKLWELQQGICPWCKKPLPSIRESTMDHIIPKSHGGTLEAGNVQLMHYACNQEKGDQCPGCPRCELRDLMDDRKKRSMEPTVYFKMPPRIEAIRLARENVQAVITWLPAGMFLNGSAEEGDVYVTVLTDGGPWVIKEGDWACRRMTDGKFFVTHDSTFRTIYAPWKEDETWTASSPA